MMIHSRTRRHISFPGKGIIRNETPYLIICPAKVKKRSQSKKSVMWEAASAAKKIANLCDGVAE